MKTEAILSFQTMLCCVCFQMQGKLQQASALRWTGKEKKTFDWLIKRKKCKNSEVSQRLCYVLLSTFQANFLDQSSEKCWPVWWFLTTSAVTFGWQGKLGLTQHLPHASCSSAGIRENVLGTFWTPSYPLAIQMPSTSQQATSDRKHGLLIDTAVKTILNVQKHEPSQTDF